MSEASAAADDLDKLAKSADNAGKALEENAKAASLAGAKLDKLKELAIGAVGGEETVEKYKKATEALKIFGDKGASTGQRAVAGGVAAKQLGAAFAAAGGAVLGAAGAVVQFVGDMYKAEAAAAQYDARLGAVSGSLAAMRAATAGAVDTQVAFNTSFALADRGIQASAANMATLARATREFARDRQVSQEQASAVVQRALDGDAQAATQLGLRLNDTTTATQRHAAVIQQLEARYRGVAAEQQTAAERAQVLERAQDQANNKIKSALGYLIMGPTVSALYTGLINSIANQTENTEAATKAQTRHNAVLKQSADLARARNQAEQERANTERRNATVSLGALNEELQRRGLIVAAFGQTVNAEQAYIRARVDAEQVSRRADETEAQFAQRKIELAQRLIDASRRRNAEATRQDTLRNAEAELGVMARQIRSMGGMVDARIRSITPAQRLAQIQREIANFAARENESIEETYSRRNALYQQQQAALQASNEASNRAQDTAEARRTLTELETEAATMGVKRGSVERRAGEQQFEYLTRRIERQRELNGITQEATQDQELQNRVSQESQRIAEKFNETQGEEDRLARERMEMMEQADTDRARALMEQVNAQRAVADERRRDLEDAQDLERQLRRNFGLVEDLNERSQTATETMTAGAKDAAGGFGELARGIFDATVAAANSGEDVGAAAAKAVDDWATAKAVQWGFQAIEALAGAGLAYFIRPDAVPGLLSSAALYGSLAAVAGITAAAIPNAPAASSGSGAGGGDRLASSSRNERAAESKGAPAMVFNVSGFTSTESAQEGIVRALQDAQRRGILPGGSLR